MTRLVLGASFGAISSGANQFNRAEKLVLTCGSLISMAIFWEAGRLFRIPAYPHFSASLLQQPNLFASLFVTLIIYLVSILICSIVAGRVRFDAGLFCTSIGLFILCLRGGPSRYAFFTADGPGVLITFCVEIIVLAAILFAGYFLQRFLCRSKLLHEDDPIDIEADAPHTISQHLLGLACNVIVIFVIVMLLAQSDRKAQVAGALAVACSAGACVAYYVSPAPLAVWFWCAPLIAGAIGYLVNDFSGLSGWQIGQLHGTFAPLARPMPLDYAGIGVAASILGYWASRQWSHKHEHDSIPDNEPQMNTDKHR